METRDGNKAAQRNLQRIAYIVWGGGGFSELCTVDIRENSLKNLLLMSTTILKLLKATLITYFVPVMLLSNIPILILGQYNILHP